MTGVVTQQIALVKQQIPSHVRLIAVTKQVTVAKMREAYAVGIRDFGENRLQEALTKQEQLRDLSDLCWHFIGHIQKNKAKKIIEHFTWIHSVDSLALAQRLNRLAQELSCSPQVCLQVKLVPDESKYGWHASELLEDLPHLNQLSQINIQGLMTILPLGLSETETLLTFEKTQKLAAEIDQQHWSNIHMRELSMGMSGDYLLAVKAGATMIRVGRTIFGERRTNNK